ncbi:MAG: hypothetical protein V3R81_15695, partial [Gammaproteobacteria bacterium]
MTYQDYAEKIERFAKGKQNHGTNSDPNKKDELEPTGVAAVTEKIGRVVSVAGSQVIALLTIEYTLTDTSGTGGLQIGALVKMRTPETMVFGMVSGLSIPIPGQSPEEREMRIVELELVGESTQGP